MSIENALIARLIALGTNAGARVYREVIVQEPILPAIAVSRQSGAFEARSLDNSYLYQRTTLRVETIGDSMAQVAVVALAIANGIDGWAGAQPNGVFVLRSRLVNQAENADAEGDRTFRVVQQDFEVLFR